MSEATAFLDKKFPVQQRTPLDSSSFTLRLIEKLTAQARAGLDNDDDGPAHDLYLDTELLPGERERQGGDKTFTKEEDEEEGEEETSEEEEGEEEEGEEEEGEEGEGEGEKVRRCLPPAPHPALPSHLVIP